MGILEHELNRAKSNLRLTLGEWLGECSLVLSKGPSITGREILPVHGAYLRPIENLGSSTSTVLVETDFLLTKLIRTEKHNLPP